METNSTDQSADGSTAGKADCSKAAHHPDRLRLPKKLQSLDWEANTDPTRLWEDCTRLLAAVPVSVRTDQPRGAWYYEINVVTVKCDEHFFTVECNDEAWGWELSDVEFFVVI